MAGKTLVVIGGGAAGFFCAVNAARLNSNLKVVLLEKSSKLLSKVRISGGGRCNVTHALFDIVEMSKRYPRGQNFVKKTFHQFFTTDTIKWFEDRGVKIKAEGDGRMFPVSDSSESIIHCLLQEANKYGVEIRMNYEVKSIDVPAQVERTSEALSTDSRLMTDAIRDARFTIHGSIPPDLKADYICIASGGYPKASMFSWLQSLGHSIAEPVPSLFTFNLPKHPITELMGVSVEGVRVKIEGSKLAEEGPVLITHWGLSGPAVLRLSAWGARELVAKNYDFRVHLNWVPRYSEQTLKEQLLSARFTQPSKKVANHNFVHLPARLWQFLLTASGIGEDQRFADLPAKSENALVRHLVDYTVDVKGKTTFKEEFVTAGGINLGEIDPNTLMSRKVSNLFFAGEILDVDGITGGFNFQHAWTSGWIAAQTIAKAAG
jgi:predicted Rossmann fold flavoprotein